MMCVCAFVVFLPLPLLLPGVTERLDAGTGSLLLVPLHKPLRYEVGR